MSGHVAKIDIEYQIDDLTGPQAERIQAAVAAEIERTLHAVITTAMIDGAPRAFADQIVYEYVTVHAVEKVAS